jgi:hypothetical protein
MQSAARFDLDEIYKAQLRYQKQHGKYASTLKECQMPSDYDPSYTIFFNNKVEFDGSRPEAALPAYYKNYFNESEWNAFGIRNLDSDDDLDVWMINNTGKLFHLEDDCKENRGWPF